MKAKNTSAGGGWSCPLSPLFLFMERFFVADSGPCAREGSISRETGERSQPHRAKRGREGVTGEYWVRQGRAGLGAGGRVVGHTRAYTVVVFRDLGPLFGSLSGRGSVVYIVYAITITERPRADRAGFQLSYIVFWILDVVICVLAGNGPTAHR
ncbi:hypothetical protein F4861DRAFT_474269 [Xylaria intraflava]|nr:hypothetical protein F4861DRAFT_474269 [Xylaria intraflava]